MKIKNDHILNIGYVNSLYRWVMSAKLLVNDFKWVEDGSEFNEAIIYIKVMKDSFLKLLLNILKIYITFQRIYP